MLGVSPWINLLLPRLAVSAITRCEKSWEAVDPKLKGKKDCGSLVAPARPKFSAIFRLPSGYVKIAIENGHRHSEFSH